MLSISSLIIRFTAAYFLTFAMSAHAAKCDLGVDVSAPKLSRFEQISNICVVDANGELSEVQLGFDLRNVRLFLKAHGKRLLLEDIGRDFDPAKVGALGHVRFLPTRLQAYLSQGYLLFVSSRRSAGGDGGGQCGSGVEDYLNVLDVNVTPVRVKARFLIGSCIDDVDLVDVDKFEDFKSFWVADGLLNMQFLSYDARCEDKLRAVLDSDFRKLRFVGSRASIGQK